MFHHVPSTYTMAEPVAMANVQSKIPFGLMGWPHLTKILILPVQEFLERTILESNLVRYTKRFGIYIYIPCVYWVLMFHCATSCSQMSFSNYIHYIQSQYIKDQLFFSHGGYVSTSPCWMAILRFVFEKPCQAQSTPKGYGPRPPEFFTSGMLKVLVPAAIVFANIFSNWIEF